MSDAVPYEHLTPDVIIDAVEGCGFECTGSILGLASYENRVYQIGVTDGFVVAKFYRPGRWSTDAILEEHDFALELAEQDIPVVAPLVRDGYSLREHEGYRFAVYERRGGRWPELGTSEDREWLGRFLGRIHAVGARAAVRRSGATLDPRGDGRARGRAGARRRLAAAASRRRATSASRSSSSTPSSSASRTSATIASCAFTATAIATTCCGPTTGRTSSISTTA